VGGIVGGAGVGSGVGESVSRAGAFTARVGSGGKDCGRADGEPVLAVGTDAGRAGATVIPGATVTPGVAGLRVGGALGGAVGDATAITALTDTPPTFCWRADVADATATSIAVRVKLAFAEWISVATITDPAVRLIMMMSAKFIFKSSASAAMKVILLKVLMEPATVKFAATTCRDWGPGAGFNVTGTDVPRVG